MTAGRFASTTLVGFDSAWADNPRAPGAICALAFDTAGHARFEAPILVGFDAAAFFIDRLHDPERRTLVAIDQPTIVPNQTGARPCERVAATVISWSGGGIQPAFRGKQAMFGDGAPIWRFLDRLGFIDDPERAIGASTGGFCMEVFPALALIGLAPGFAGRGLGPRYNPARKTFRQDAWQAVCEVTTQVAHDLAFDAVAEWCGGIDRTQKPRKALQDQLDSVICLLVAALWLSNRTGCSMIGDLSTGYVVAPTSPTIAMRLKAAALARGVALT